MAKPLVPRALLDPVVAYFKPQRVILFGSKARGDAGPDSDIDLMVVLDDDAPAEKLTWRARYEARKSYGRPADLFTVRAEAFERNRGIIGTLEAEADIDGIVVYGSAKGRPPMKAPDPTARWQAVQRWLAVADADRKAVALCIAAEPPLRSIAAFHCQQAVEKLFKGFLTVAGKRSRKTHSLSQLGVLAQESFPELGEFVAAVDNWSRWVAEFRYPGGTEPEPDDDELRRALDVIDRLAASLRAKRP